MGPLSGMRVLVKLSPPGGGDPLCGFTFCYSGPQNHADRVLAPLKSIGGMLNDGSAAMDYVALQRSGDVDDPRALGQYLTGGFIRELGPDLVNAIVEGFRGHPDRGTQLFFQQAGGAISRVSPDATAFGQRYAFANLLTGSGWAMGSDPEPHMAYSRQYFSTLRPFTGGFYANDIAREASRADISANYGPNQGRLVQLKNRYDPTNLFRLNANIEPTV